jgi:hypothetical protein
VCVRVCACVCARVCALPGPVEGGRGPSGRGRGHIPASIACSVAELEQEVATLTAAAEQARRRPPARVPLPTCAHAAPPARAPLSPWSLRFASASLSYAALGLAPAATRACVWL